MDKGLLILAPLLIISWLAVGRPKVKQRRVFSKIRVGSGRVRGLITGGFALSAFVYLFRSTLFYGLAVLILIFGLFILRLIILRERKRIRASQLNSSTRPIDSRQIFREE